MMRKQQFSHFILSNNKDENKFKPIYRSRPSFQRPKQELIKQILAHYFHKNGQQTNGKQANVKQEIHYLYQYAYDAHHYHHLFSAKQQTEQQMSIVQRQQSGLNEFQHKYLDEYVRNLTKDKCKVDLVMQISSTSNDQYQIIDHFIKKSNNKDAIAIGSFTKANVPHQRLQNNNKNNESKPEIQSTMILSQFYRSSHVSPKIRKTEFSDSKKQQFNDDKIQQGHKLPSARYQISHSSKRQQQKKQPSNFLQGFACQKGKQAQICEFNKNRNILSSNNNNKFISSQKNASSFQKRTSKVRPRSPLGRIDIKDFRDEEKPQYYYDKEINIFDSIKERKEKTPSQIKFQLKDIKKMFSIKNEDDFKRQINKEGQKFANKKIIISKKPKEELFNGNQQLNLKRYIQKQVNNNKINNKIENSDQSIVGSYQLERCTMPGEANSKAKQQQLKKSESIKKTDGVKIKKKMVNVLDLSMQPELSNQQSSSCSFINQKQQVNQKGIQNINNIVNQSVKAVNLNIERVETFRSKFISDLNYQQSQQTPIKIQPSNNLPKLQKKSIEARQKAFKNIFGDINKAKSDEQAGISVIFFKNEANSEGQLISRPSSIRKVSEQKSNKSFMMNNLQDLSDNSRVGQLPHKDSYHDISKQELEHASQQKEILIISQDAISFSKLADATIQDQQPHLNITAQDRQLRTVEVKKISIQLDPFSDQQDKGNEEEANLDDLQDYDSNQQQPNRNSNHKQIKPQTLQPVIEEDLQESQFKNCQFKSKLSKQFSKQSQNTNKKSLQSSHKMQIIKKASEQGESRTQKSSDLFKISKSISKVQRGDTSINNVLVQKDEFVVQQYSSYQLDPQQELMKSIRNDISNLKSKIQSSIIIQPCDLSKEISGISDPIPSNQKKKISFIQLKSNSSSKTSIKKQNSLMKMFKEKSFLNDKKESKQLTSNKSNTSQINFDKINNECQNQYYKEFKQDFTNLKKKMLLDAGVL